jgi:hypothetical protein
MVPPSLEDASPRPLHQANVIDETAEKRSVESSFGPSLPFALPPSLQNLLATMEWQIREITCPKQSAKAVRYSLSDHGDSSQLRHTGDSTAGEEHTGPQRPSAEHKTATAAVRAGLSPSMAPPLLATARTHTHTLFGHPTSKRRDGFHAKSLLFSSPVVSDPHDRVARRVEQLWRFPRATTARH